MSLQTHLRGLRATTAVLACAALALSPAAAMAKKHAAKKPAAQKLGTALKEAKNPKPAKLVAAPAPSTNANGLGNKLGLGPTMQLAAMNTAITAAPGFYTGRTTGCAKVTAMLANEPGQIMAGNFRDGEGYCYVWLNLEQSSMLTGSEICKTTLHEMGHLNGLQHSQDPDDVMFAPFRSDPIPAVCQAHVS